MAKTDINLPDHDNESRITLGLLNMVDDNSSTSQRSMASDLGIALGLANAYLKRCVKTPISPDEFLVAMLLGCGV